MTGEFHTAEARAAPPKIDPDAEAAAKKDKLPGC